MVDPDVLDGAAAFFLSCVGVGGFDFVADFELPDGFGLAVGEQDGRGGSEAAGAFGESVQAGFVQFRCREHQEGEFHLAVLVLHRCRVDVKL